MALSYSMMHDFSECMKRTNIFNVHNCPDQYVWNSVMSYSSFYAGIGHGFTPSDCIRKYLNIQKNNPRFPYPQGVNI